MALWDLRWFGPPPGDATVGREHRISLQTIPTGSKLWVGTCQYWSPGKSIVFEIRDNLAGQSAGTTGATRLLYTKSVSPKGSGILNDLTKRGMHIATIVGTGSEKLWLRLTSKSSTLTGYTYDLNGTTE
jgi:hypothetical protein